MIMKTENVMKELNASELNMVNGGGCPRCGMTVYDETNGIPAHSSCPRTPGIWEKIFKKEEFISCF